MEFYDPKYTYAKMPSTMESKNPLVFLEGLNPLHALDHQLGKENWKAVLGHNFG